MQYNEVYDAAAKQALQRNIAFVARPQAFAIKVPAFFTSGLSTALIAPLMLVGLQTYTDLVNIGICGCVGIVSCVAPDALRRSF